MPSSDSKIQIARYTSKDAAAWDAFIDCSKNGTFLFKRGFMEYHADRFQDHSLMVRLDGKVCAVLPANQSDQALISHAGLSYGGFVTDDKMSAARMLDIFGALVDWLRARDFATLRYKVVPAIYHRQPAEEDIYALFRLGAELVRVDVAASIPVKRRLTFSKGKKDGLRKARKAELTVRETDDWAGCWQLITAVLAERHDTAPVHSLDEIKLLAGRFPDAIRLYGAYDAERMLSALVVFDCGQTAHVQYIASSDDGRAHGGVDAIVNHLLEVDFADHEWFDFGISTTDAGRNLNTGLAAQKEMFGARSTTCLTYELTL